MKPNVERNNVINRQQGGERFINRRIRDENNPQGAQQQRFNNNNQQQQNHTQNGDFAGGDRPPRRTGGGGFDRGDQRGGGGGGGGPPRRTYGKREFDRQSGSDKTGVKAVDKRDGGGAHNWGTHKQDIEDLNKSGTATDSDVEKDAAGGGVTTTVDGGDVSAAATTGGGGSAREREESAAEAEARAAALAAAEEEAKAITLDEWKAQRAVRSKPQFNIRQAGEGEDTSQWKQMIVLQKKKADGAAGGVGDGTGESDEELEYDPAMYPQRVGRQKHLLDIEFHFNDGRRGGGGGMNRGGSRSGGGGGRGGPPMGGRGGGRGGGGGGRDRDAAAAAGGDEDQPPRVQKPRSRPNDENRRERRGGPYQQNLGHAAAVAAPKVDDERAFPSLG